MAFNWKKLAKKAIKLGGQIAKPILARTPVGQAVLKGQQVLKALGSNLKAARLGKIEPLSVQAAVSKIATPLAKRTLSRMPRKSSPPSWGDPTKPRSMPVGTYAERKAWLKMVGLKESDAESRRMTGKKASRMPQDRKTPAAKGRRTPPKGGLDLKAMAAEWRAAGKPGTWLGWIKANQIKKAS